MASYENHEQETQQASEFLNHGFLLYLNIFHLNLPDALMLKLNGEYELSYLGSLYTSPGWMSTRGSSLIPVKSKFCLHKPGLLPLTATSDVS